MAGIKEVAEKAGVSPSTVSNVLNGKSNVSSSTKEHVLMVCQELDYHPNEVGRQLRSTDARTILFNFSDFDRSFYLHIIQGIRDCTASNHYDFVISTTHSCKKYMHRNMTSGCIILDKAMKNETLVKYAKKDYPIIVLDRHIDHPYIKSMTIDNYASMSCLMEGLVQRGYHSMAFLSGPEYTEDTQERYQAFIDVQEKHGIHFRRNYYYPGDYREESGIRTANIIMLSQVRPDILVCANDNMAIGAIKAFRNRGIQVPEDIAVTGFDNNDMADLAGLTTIDIPNYERGYLAAQNMINIINSDQSMEPVELKARVLWRTSTRSLTDYETAVISQ